MDKKRILIVEDHTIIREGLKALLSAAPDIQVVGEAKDGLEAIKMVNSLSPDLVLMDLSMPRMNGLEAIKDISRGNPDTKVLVLTVHKSDEYILATFQAGAHGYVLKDASHAELMLALQTLFDGKRYVSPDISDLVIQGFVGNKMGLKSESSWDTLTNREREILKLVAEGNKNKDIADLLCISVKTVERHRANLMKKLGLHNVSALTALAIEKGLVVT